MACTRRRFALLGCKCADKLRKACEQCQMWSTAATNDLLFLVAAWAIVARLLLKLVHCLIFLSPIPVLLLHEISLLCMYQQQAFSQVAMSICAAGDRPQSLLQTGPDGTVHHSAVPQQQVSRPTSLKVDGP